MRIAPANVSAETDSVLLIRAVDAGATYLSFRWLDDPARPDVHAVAEPEMRRLLGRLDSALGGSTAAPADDSAAVRQALSGQLTRYLSEYALSEALTRAIIPDRIRIALRNRAERGRVTVRITPSRSLARVPFELFVIADPVRLIEIADVCYEPPATVHVGRGRLPEPWTDDVAARPVLYVVDPRLPAGSGKRRILPPRGAGGGTQPTNTELFEQRISARAHTTTSGVHKSIGRWELRDDLLERPGRFLYFGHVSSTLDAPGSASLHLDDDGAEWGLAQPMNAAHVPLSALDLLLGTAAPELGPAEGEPFIPGCAGYQLWPMPTRVALIACESGVDYRSTETFGLVMAILSSGAEVVTTTRWTLPSDAAFAEICGMSQSPGPTTELALAVDDTHCAQDPVAALAQWQRTKLEQWRSTPGPATSPLTWAAVGVHVCPVRAVIIPTGSKVSA